MANARVRISRRRRSANSSRRGPTHFQKRRLGVLEGEVGPQLLDDVDRLAVPERGQLELTARLRDRPRW